MGIFDNPPTAPEDMTDGNLTGQAGEGAENNQEGAAEVNRQPEENQAGGEQTQQAEQLILGKFKSQDDLAKAYQEAQSRLGQLGNELGQLRQQVQVQQPEPAEPEQPKEWTDEEWQAYDNQFMSDFAANPGRAVVNVVSQLLDQHLAPIYQRFEAQQTEQARNETIEAEFTSMVNAVGADGNPLYPDIEEMADKLDEYLEAHPELLDVVFTQGTNRAKGGVKDGDYGILDVLYRSVKASMTEQLGQQAYQNGLQQGMEQTLQKITAGLPKPGAKNTQQTLTPEDAIISEMMAFKKGDMFG